MWKKWYMKTWVYNIYSFCYLRNTKLYQCFVPEITKTLLVHPFSILSALVNLFHLRFYYIIALFILYGLFYFFLDTCFLITIICFWLKSYIYFVSSLPLTARLSLVSRETKNQKLSVLSATVKSKDHHPLRFFWKTNHLQPAYYHYQHLKDELGVWTYALAVKSLKIWIQRLICRTVEVCVVHSGLTVCCRSFVFWGYC